MARYTLYPAIDVDVLAFHDRSTVCWIVPPDPLAVSVALVELLVRNAMFADTVPVVWGAKVTEKGML